MRACPSAPARVARRARALAGACAAVFWLAAVPVRAAPLALAVSPGPVSLPLYVAEARGFFKDEGVDVQLRDCASGRECYQWLADGRVEVATAAELQVATGAAVHRDLAIFATISTSSYQIKLVARRSAQVAEAPQIRGKRVATVPGSSARYFLDSWLVFNDVDPATVTLVGLAPDQLLPALEARAVDAIAIWEPLASAAALALGGDAVTFASPRVYTQHFNLVCARATLERRDPDVRRLLRALQRAQRAIQAHPAAAQALLAARLHLAPALAATVMEGQDYRVRLDQSLVTTMQGQVRWAAHGGRANVDLLRTIEPGPLRRLDPAAVGLVQ